MFNAHFTGTSFFSARNHQSTQTGQNAGGTSTSAAEDTAAEESSPPANAAADDPAASTAAAADTAADPAARPSPPPPPQAVTPPAVRRAAVSERVAREVLNFMAAIERGLPAAVGLPEVPGEAALEDVVLGGGGGGGGEGRNGHAAPAMEQVVKNLPRIKVSTRVLSQKICICVPRFSFRNAREESAL